MDSTSTKAAMKSILKPVTTLKGHKNGIGGHIAHISYFPGGQRMISGSRDKTARQWDLKAGKEIEEVRGVREESVSAMAVSRDGRWVVTAGGDFKRAELKACQVETGIVKTFTGHSRWISCIDISADGILLASGSWDGATRIWNLETGKLVVGSFKSNECLCTVRFSTDSKKLAIKSLYGGNCLEVWDVQTQKLDVGIRNFGGGGITSAPIFWTYKNKNILATFSFTFTVDDDDDTAKTIYEFDASTLETVRTPFEGHTKLVTNLALSSDSTLLASASNDHTIKLWAFESRQLLASFDVQNLDIIILSPNSRQLAYTTYIDNEIHICNTPPDVLAQAGTSAHDTSTLSDVLKSDATRRPSAVRRKAPIYVTPMSQRPIDPQPSISLRLRRLLRFPHRTNAVPPIRNDQLCGPLDFPATLPLPHRLSGRTTTQGHINSGENSRSLPITQSSATSNTRPHNLSTWWPVRVSHAQPHIVDVPLAQGKERNAAADAPKKDDDIVPDEYFDPPSPNPDSQQPAAAAQNNTGEHGGDQGCCFCF